MSLLVDLWINVHDVCTSEVMAGVDIFLTEIATGETTQGITNAAGSWNVGYVMPGQFIVTIGVPGYYEHLNQYGVGLDGGIINIGLMPVGGCIVPPPEECDVGFTVSDDAGNRLSGVAMVLWSSSNSYEGTTNFNGVVNFLGIPLDYYAWTASLTGYDPVSGAVACTEAGGIYNVPVTLGLIPMTITLTAVGNGRLGFQDLGELVTNKAYVRLPGNQTIIAAPDVGHYLERWVITNADYPSGRNWGWANPLGIGLTIDTLVEAVFVEEVAPPECTVDADCPAGYVCIGGVCVPELPPVNNPPVADPDGPYEGLVNQAIQFDGSGSYDPDSGDSISKYKWNFGDGTTSTRRRPTHTYATAGTYQVSLKVWDTHLATDKQYSYCVVTDGGGAPVTWVVPDAYESGVYQWSLKFSIVPIPFLDNWIVQMIAGRQDDEANLNQMLADQGATGTATIIEKTLTKHTNWLGNVDSFTIWYKVAFSGSIETLKSRATLFAWAVLIPFIPLFVGVLKLIIIGLIINHILSTIKKIAGPQEYTPETPGDCAEGFIYDVDRNLCIREKADIPWHWILFGVGAVAVLSMQKKD